MDANFPLKPRPKLAQWMFDRGLVPADLSASLQVSSETIRRYCLPIGHPERRRPHGAVMRRIVNLTSGEVQPPDFPETGGAAGSEAVIEGAAP